MGDGGDSPVPQICNGSSSDEAKNCFGRQHTQRESETRSRVLSDVQIVFESCYVGLVGKVLFKID